MAVAKTARQVTGKRIVRQALTKGTIYPIVKKVAYYLGLQMNKHIFGSAVGHAIPLLGGALSGVMTYATFAPMARKLKGYLRETPLAKPSNASVIDVESFDAASLALRLSLTKRLKSSRIPDPPKWGGHTSLRCQTRNGAICDQR